MLTAERELGLLADDRAVDVLGHTDVGPSMFLYGVGDNQVPTNQAVVLIWLLHQLDFPVVTAPSRHSTI